MKIKKFETNSQKRNSAWRVVTKKYLHPSSLAVYSGTFLAIIAVVAISYQPPEQFGSSASAVEVKNSATQLADVPIDDIIATNVAANVAQTANLPIVSDVSNLSQSLVAGSVLSTTDGATAIEKPQVFNTDEATRDIKIHETLNGESIGSIAEKYGLSKETIKWANNLTKDEIEPGKKLKILPVDGVLYRVREGDSVKSIAKRYGADSQQLALFNDLELDGVKQGREIIVPSGKLPEAERPGYVAPVQSAPAGYSNGISGSFGGGSGVANNMRASGGNRYAFGNCTWYAYERRAQLGRPVQNMWGNASTWASYARAAGYTVNGTPAVGAVMQNAGGWYGHVAVVESVNPGVSVTISEMNAYRFGGGFNRIGTGQIPWNEATSGMYSYIH